jgi:hypothetical protein
MYLTGVYSKYSATTSAFLVHIYIPMATPDVIANIMSMQLNDMQRACVLNLVDDSACNITVHPLLDTIHTTHLDDERIIQTTTMASPHLEGTPHAYIATTPTLFSVTYGLTLMASRQLRWTTTLLEEDIPARLPKTLRKSLLAQIPTITRNNADKPINGKETCTIHSHAFLGLSVTATFSLFRAAAILTLHEHLTVMGHKHKNQRAKSIDNPSQATQALLQALDSVQPVTPWHTDGRQNTMVFTPAEVDYNSLRLQAQPYVIHLQDPISIKNTIKFSIKPPRIRSYTR